MNFIYINYAICSLTEFQLAPYLTIPMLIIIFLDLKNQSEKNSLKTCDIRDQSVKNEMISFFSILYFTQERIDMFWICLISILVPFINTAITC